MVLTFDSLEEVLAFAQKLTGIVKDEPVKKKEAPKTEPEQETTTKPELETTTEPEDTKSEITTEPEEEITYSMMDVRAVLAEVKKKSGSAALKHLLDSFGAAKLSDVKSEDYAELIKKAGEL